MRSGLTAIFLQHIFLLRKRSKRYERKTEKVHRLLIKSTKLLIVQKSFIIIGSLFGEKKFAGHGVAK